MREETGLEFSSFLFKTLISLWSFRFNVDQWGNAKTYSILVRDFRSPTGLDSQKRRRSLVRLLQSCFYLVVRFDRSGRLGRSKSAAAAVDRSQERCRHKRRSTTSTRFGTWRSTATATARRFVVSSICVVLRVRHLLLAGRRLDDAQRLLLDTGTIKTK